MKFYVMTDVGRKRASNQDAFCCARLDNGVEFVVLCDGMGGHRGGNVASEIAVRGFRELLAACMTPELRPKELKSLLSGHHRSHRRGEPRFFGNGLHGGSGCSLWQKALCCPRGGQPRLFVSRRKASPSYAGSFLGAGSH